MVEPRRKVGRILLAVVRAIEVGIDAQHFALMAGAAFHPRLQRRAFHRHRIPADAGSVLGPALALQRLERRQVVPGVVRLLEQRPDEQSVGIDLKMVIGTVGQHPQQRAADSADADDGERQPEQAERARGPAARRGNVDGAVVQVEDARRAAHPEDREAEEETKEPDEPELVPLARHRRREVGAVCVPDRKVEACLFHVLPQAATTLHHRNRHSR